MGVKKGADNSKASAPFVEQELFGPWDFDPQPQQFDLQIREQVVMKSRRRSSGRKVVKVRLGGNRL